MKSKRRIPNIPPRQGWNEEFRKMAERGDDKLLDDWLVLDQIRTVDKERLVKKLGPISASAQKEVLSVLAEMFAE